MIWNNEAIAEYGDTLIITLCKRIKDLELLIDAREDEIKQLRHTLHMKEVDK